VLFDKLAFGNREPVAQKKIFQGVMVQNVENMEARLTPHLKVVAQGISAQPVEILAATHKTIERFARVG
jgi:hypothetical protein